MSKASILIVEDEIIISKAAALSLQSLGYEVADTVITGQEAIDRARELKPDLILMDIFLPGELDGIATANIIRQELGIPIVFATALGDDETISRARVSEPFGYIIKPYDKSDLRGAIEMALHKFNMDRKVKENERWLSTMMNNLIDAVLTTDAEGIVRSANPVAVSHIQCPMDRPLAQHVRVVDEAGNSLLASAMEERQTLIGEYVLQPCESEPFPADVRFKPILAEDSETLLGFLLTFSDITERRHAQEERESLISELREALDNVKTLSGLLPICARCKKIRDDGGYWKQVEEYLAATTEVEFTHGLCPDCANELYPEYNEDEEDE